MIPRIQFHFITLFPGTINVWFSTSILGRALERQLFSFETIQLRDFAVDRHRTVDDSAYGGGGGMVLKVEPLVRAVESCFEKYGRENCTVIYFSPAGERMDQPLINGFTPDKPQHFILVCGHYEGVDQRFIEQWTDRQLSLGDFVLTGGEIPAIAFADSLIRQLDGTIAHEKGCRTESFSLADQSGKPLLEYPHFTRPEDFRGFKVPSVLLTGDHQEIAKWRKQASLEQTTQRRPDLVK